MNIRRKQKKELALIGITEHAPKVHFVSHPDDDHTPLNYEHLVRAAKENEVALEVNNSSLVKEDQRLNCYENYKEMLPFCEKYRVPIIVSSDAHDPSWVGEFTLAEKFLNVIFSSAQSPCT